MGKLTDNTGGFTLGTLVLAGFLLAATLIWWSLSRVVRSEMDAASDF